VQGHAIGDARQPLLGQLVPAGPESFSKNAGKRAVDVQAGRLPGFFLPFSHGQRSINAV